MFTFNDIFKSSFLSQAGGVTANPLLMTVSVVLLITFSVLIRIVYKKTFRGVMYSKTFGTSLSLVVLVTGFVIMAISSNVILSLGMVGALSIIRFRTAVKDPMDITYMFWAVGLGITTGAGLFFIAVLLFIVITIFLLTTAKEILFDQPYLFVFSCINESAEHDVMRILNEAVKKTKLRSKIVSKERIEISVELCLQKNRKTLFVSEISALPGVSSASLLSAEGDLSI